MSTAAKVLKIARAELDTSESPPGSNSVKYNRWYWGSDARYPWCAAFVSWVLDQAGIVGYKHAYTPSGVDLFKKRGEWHPGTAGVQAGDIVYFDFPDSTFRVQHVGIAVGEEVAGYIPTIEGNTSAVSQDNGGEVQRRSRPRSHIVGYGRPAYSHDDDYLLRVGDNKPIRFERLKMALQKAEAAVKKGRRVHLRRV